MSNIIHDTTCTKCKHCGQYTNYADDPHHQARRDRVRELERQLAVVSRRLEGVREWVDYARTYRAEHEDGAIRHPLRPWQFDLLLALVDGEGA